MPTLKMFVQTNAGVASKPGSSQRNVRLVPVPPNADGSNDNAALFAGGAGGAVLDLQNLASAEAAALPEGAIVEVSLTIPPAPAP